jgi:hypothetical protein
VLFRSDGEVQFDDGSGAKVTMKDLGISCPVLVNATKPYLEELPDPNADTAPGAAPGMGSRGAVGGPNPMGGMGGMPGEPGMPGMPGMGSAGGRRPMAGGDPATAANTIKLQRFDFTVHFCWQPKTPSERQALKALEKAKTSGQP